MCKHGGAEYQFWASKLHITGEPMPCTSCHTEMKELTEVMIPVTGYNSMNWRSTKYAHFWLCDRCMGKLREALANPIDPAGRGCDHV